MQPARNLLEAGGCIARGNKGLSTNMSAEGWSAGSQRERPSQLLVLLPEASADPGLSLGVGPALVMANSDQQCPLSWSVLTTSVSPCYKWGNRKIRAWSEATHTQLAKDQGPNGQKHRDPKTRIWMEA